MEQLPPHVATADEPIRPLGDHRWAGPDLRGVTPLPDMLCNLRDVADDTEAYIALWRHYIAEAGLSLDVREEQDGGRYLTIGGACDAQMRHRNRYQHFLCDDLDNDDGERRALLEMQLGARSVARVPA